MFGAMLPVARIYTGLPSPLRESKEREINVSFKIVTCALTVTNERTDGRMGERRFHFSSFRIANVFLSLSAAQQDDDSKFTKTCMSSSSIICWALQLWCSVIYIHVYMYCINNKSRLGTKEEEDLGENMRIRVSAAGKKVGAYSLWASRAPAQSKSSNYSRAVSTGLLVGTAHKKKKKKKIVRSEQVKNDDAGGKGTRRRRRRWRPHSVLPPPLGRLVAHKKK